MGEETSPSETSVGAYASAGTNSGAAASPVPSTAPEPVPAALVARHHRSPLPLVGVGSVVALVATLAPLLLISAYNHSYADDWHYGVWAHLTLEDTGGNVFAAIVTAFEQVGKAWLEWQGTYSAILLMALEPSVWGEGWYVLAAPLILGVLVAATFFFVHVGLVEYLHADCTTWVSVSCVTLVVQLLLQPSPVEGIFWFNSAVYYTFYHSLMLVLAALLMRIVHPSRAGRSTLGLDVGAALLAAFVAGGNYVTVLVCAEGVCALLVGLLVRRHPRSTDVFPTFALLVIGTTLNMVAPGNSVRQATQFPGDGAGVVGTVWQSFLAGFQYLGSWTTALVVLAVLLVLPLAVRAVSTREASHWGFGLPGMVTIASIAVFASSFTPTFWSMGTVGPGRVQNCRFDLYVILVMVNLFWWCGWAHRRRREVSQAAPCAIASRSAAGICGLVGLVACIVVGTMCLDSTTAETLSSVSAARSLSSGQAADYDEQVVSRLSQIEGSQSSDLRVPFYTNAPKVLFMGDIRDNMDNYINYRLAQWYRKDSIIGYHGSVTSSSSDSSSSSVASSTDVSDGSTTEAVSTQ